MTTDPTTHLGRLVGEWATEAKHVAIPETVTGITRITWLTGERFLEVRAHQDHPQLPDALSIIGLMGRDRVDGTPVADPDSEERQLRAHYFDERGVFRIQDVRIDDETWQIERIAPGFSQRFTGTFSEGHTVIAGWWQLRRDDEWADDLHITYRRRTPA